MNSTRKRQITKATVFFRGNRKNMNCLCRVCLLFTLCVLKWSKKTSSIWWKGMYPRTLFSCLSARKQQQKSEEQSTCYCAIYRRLTISSGNSLPRVDAARKRTLKRLTTRIKSKPEKRVLFVISPFGTI